MVSGCLHLNFRVPPNLFSILKRAALQIFTGRRKHSFSTVSVILRSRHLLLYDVVNLLQQPIAKGALTQVKPLEFNHEIKLDRVSFRYQPAAPLVLDEFDLKIAKGSRIGFVGATGSGKSTLIDLFIGLLQPSSGQISVDGAALTDAATRFVWQRNISHVPQTIYLVDGPLAENIAFDVPPKKIDRERVRLAAQRARIADFIESLDARLQHEHRRARRQTLRRPAPTHWDRPRALQTCLHFGA